MALTITIAGPLGTTKVLSTPNNMIEKHAKTIGVHRSEYDTDGDYEVAIIKQIVNDILRPHKQAKSRELGTNPDITDVITES